MKPVGSFYRPPPGEQVNGFTAKPLIVGEVGGFKFVFVRITTKKSPSWVSWMEIEILGAPTP